MGRCLQGSTRWVGFIIRSANDFLRHSIRSLLTGKEIMCYIVSTRQSGSLQIGFEESYITLIICYPSAERIHSLQKRVGNREQMQLTRWTF